MNTYKLGYTDSTCHPGCHPFAHCCGGDTFCFCYPPIVTAPSLTVTPKPGGNWNPTVIITNESRV